MFIDAIQIGMAEMKIAKAPEKLASLGLGSCVAICAYDKIIKVGGLAHIMLPDSSISGKPVNAAKFADTAVPVLLKEMQRLGAVVIRTKIIIVGGAHMFGFKGEDPYMDIGSRNVKSVEESCGLAGVGITARNVGGNFGRSVLFDLNTGKVKVRTVNQGIMEL